MVSFDEDFDALTWVIDYGVVEVGFLEVVRGRIDVAVDNNLPNIRFLKPLHWLEPAENNIRLDRLGALVQYVFLAHSRLWDLELGTECDELFRNACEVIAQKTNREECEKGRTAASDHLGKYAISGKQNELKQLIYIPTRDTTLPDAPSLSQAAGASQSAATLPRAQYDSLQSVDQAFATFRTGLVEQLNAAQKADHRQSAMPTA